MFSHYIIPFLDLAMEYLLRIENGFSIINPKKPKELPERIR